MGKQKTLYRQRAGIARERAVAADNTVTRSKKSQRIGPVGGGHSPYGSLNAKTRGLPAISQNLAKRDIGQTVPHTFLKLSAGKQQRHIKSLAVPGEIFVELSRRHSRHS